MSVAQSSHSIGERMEGSRIFQPLPSAPAVSLHSFMQDQSSPTRWQAHPSFGGGGFQHLPRYGLRHAACPATMFRQSINEPILDEVMQTSPTCALIPSHCNQEYMQLPKILTTSKLCSFLQGQVVSLRSAENSHLMHLDFPIQPQVCVHTLVLHTIIICMSLLVVQLLE